MSDFYLSVSADGKIAFVDEHGAQLRKPDQSGFIDPEDIWNGIFEPYLKKEVVDDKPDPNKRKIIVGDPGNGTPQESPAYKAMMQNAESMKE